MRVQLKSCRQSARPRRGAAAVEFAVVLPLILILLLGIWEVGRLIHVQHVLTNAVREGARHASLGQTHSHVSGVIRQYLENAGLTVVNPDIPPPTIVDEGGGELSVRVEATLRFSEVRWINLYLVTNAETTLTARSRWMVQ